MNHRLIGVVALIVGAGTAWADPPPALPVAAHRSVAPPLDFVLLGEDKLTRIELRVEIDGRRVPEIWEETFDRLLAFYDRNKDGVLDRAEAERLPSGFTLRQLLWGVTAPTTGTPVPWAELDTDNDGEVDRAELAAFYRRAGMGTVFVGVGKHPFTEKLTEAVLARLDTNGDKRVSEEEWKAAPEVLRKLDKNDDELVGPGELIPRVAYPGAMGSQLLIPPNSSGRGTALTESFPVMILPTSAEDTLWSAELIVRLRSADQTSLGLKESRLPEAAFTRLDADGDGKLSFDELSKWRSFPADHRWVVRLGNVPADKSAAEAVRGTVDLGPADYLSGGKGRLKIGLRPDEGKLPDLIAAARKRLRDRFTQADADGNGFIVPSEVADRAQLELRQLLAIADLDGDGKLSEKELTAWSDLHEQIAKGQVLLTILDHGAGLFELLDANHDGALSVPELRAAWERVRNAGCVPMKGGFDGTALSHQLLATVSRGHPTTPLGANRGTGPAWFRAMDRNGDGYLSRREFIGAAATFDKIDSDRDGLISPDEASKVQSP